MKVIFYGIFEEGDYNGPEIDVNILTTLVYGTEYITNVALPKGTEKIIQSGANGVICETYKITKDLSGKMVRELISKDKYAPLNKIIERN